MIGEYVELHTKQVTSPNLQGKDHCCKFQIMGGIVPFMWLQLTGSISHNSSILHQDTSQTQIRSIGIHHIRLVTVRNSKNRCGGQTLLQSDKSFFTLVIPNKPDILPGQLCQRQSNSREILHKTTVVACQSKETTYLCYISRPFPLQNSFNLSGID
ncbi:hypothetical protein PanWU01x14_209940 [Parasponia andersonii]|uniref:Uncharacterized protein n=1 Tax=Parasponia andersonii TaxID=3476 RepID=A0A2P5BU85_PARAD|nr:hypothetical protein PanWU01x14_209940 [Parasponia andersonii]